MKGLLRSLWMYMSAIATLFKLWLDLLYGIYRISKLKHAPVTIFGGALLKPESIYMKQARQLAYMLASNNVPVLTGGGPGIMEAATCGAIRSKGMVITTIGISVKGLESRDGTTKCQRNVIEMNDFGARKWLLIHYSVGFAVFPGGFGTLNELSEILTLIQTHLTPRAPVVLIGSEYWKPLMTWIQDFALKDGLISAEDAALFTLTDDIDVAYKLLHAHCVETKPLG